MALTMNLTNVQREAPTFKTATGGIVTLTDAKGEQYFRELQTTIEPVQDLHGQENPYPSGGGVNELPITKDTTTVSDVTFTVNKDNGGNVISITTSGTASADIVFQCSTGLSIAGSNKKLTGCPSGGGDSTYYMSAKLNGMWSASHDNGSGLGLYGTVDTVAIVVANGVNMNGKTFLPMIANSSVTSFAPYSNICPISGFSEAKVTRTGKNLLPMPITSGSYPNQVTITVNDDKSFYVSKPSGSGWTTIPLATMMLKAGTYTLIENDDSDANCSINVYLAGTTTSLTNTRYTKRRVFTVAEDTKVDINYSRSASADNVLTKLMLFVGDTATASDYEPYNGQTFTIDLDGTRYGGTLDVRRGKLTVTYGIVDLGTLYWYADTNRPGVFYSATIQTICKPQGKLICSQYLWRNQGVPSAGNLHTADNTISAYPSYGSGYIFVIDTAHASDTASDFKTAMNGVQLVYELKTPVEVDVDPEAIKTVDGINNIWADTGEVTVTYKVDPNAEPTLTLASPLGANLGSLRPIVPEAEEIIAESEDPENGANLTTESEVQNGET